jgi:DNA-damage-inducible protein J
MADNAVVRARIDERTKKEAAAALKKIGLTVSDAFRLLLVRVAAEKPCRSSRSIRMPKPLQR